MTPILFELDGLVIYSYPAMRFLAAAVAITWALLEAPRAGLSRLWLAGGFVVTIFVSLVGARVSHVLFNLESYAPDITLSTFLDFREPGGFFLGGFVVALVWALLYCRWSRISFLQVVDFCSPLASLMYAIARWGCFLGGCCYGVATDNNWGFIFPGVDYAPRHPTQLYASVAAIIIFLVLRYMYRNRYLYLGYIFFNYLILYGIYRFVIEFYRVSEPLFSFLTSAQIVSLVMVGAGLLFHCYNQCYNQKKRAKPFEFS